MNTQSISELFQVAFAAPQVIKSKLIPDAPLDYRYVIYPLNCLDQLRENIRARASGNMTYSAMNDDFLHNYAARFIVDAGGEIRFTREGPRTPSIPAHSDITSSVLTAGNIHFSQDYSQIVKITNKSGHFLPSFGSLVFALPLILASGFPLADRVILVNEATKEEGVFTLDELRSLKPDGYDIEQIRALNQSNEVFIDTLASSSPTASAELASSSMFASFSTAQARTFTQVNTDGGYETPEEGETIFSPAKKKR